MHCNVHNLYPNRRGHEYGGECACPGEKPWPGGIRTPSFEPGMAANWLYNLEKPQAETPSQGSDPRLDKLREIQIQKFFQPEQWSSKWAEMSISPF